MARIFLMLTFILASLVAGAQFSRKSMDSISRLSYADYKIMLKQLHIDSTRRGPSGNPKAPDAANTDESKATPYTSLPDPLLLKNGMPVKDSETWWKKRRAEIVEDFDREIYGRIPETIPAVSWEVVSTKKDTVEGIPAITKQLVGHVDNRSYPAISVNIHMSLTTPVHVKGPFR